MEHDDDDDDAAITRHVYTHPARAGGRLFACSAPPRLPRCRCVELLYRCQQADSKSLWTDADAAEFLSSREMDYLHLAAA